MHGRTFSALCAAAFALTAVGGLVFAVRVPSGHDAHGTLLAFLLAAAFTVAAFLQPAPRLVCGRCGGLQGVGFDFCVSCGDAPAPR